MTRSLVLAASLLAATACASASEPAPAAPTRTALETLRAGADFRFSLDESDPAARFRADCAAAHPGDTAASDACYAQIREQGATEGLRFALDPKGRVVWTSYGRENGAEAVYMEGALDAQAESERIVASRFAEPPHGLQIDEKGQPPPGMTMRFQLVDDDTLVMLDPHKGKLVFHRVR